MNLPEVLTEVLRLTNRPDKSAETVVAINKAISYCTLKGSFRRDLVEASIAISPSAYGATISLAGLTRFRRFTYVKPTAVKRYLEPIGEAQVFSPSNNTQLDRYYVAGTSLTYTLSQLTSSLEVGYLTYAPVLAVGSLETHWMLDLMPFAIIDLATARIFQSVGDDSSAKSLENSGMEFFKTAKADLSLGE